MPFNQTADFFMSVKKKTHAIYSPLFSVLQQIANYVLFSCLSSVGAASSVVNMRRITHPAVQQTLAGKAVLPCVFTLQTSSSSQPPHLLWTRIRAPAKGEGAPLEQIVLSAKGRIDKCCFLDLHYSTLLCQTA